MVGLQSIASWWPAFEGMTGKKMVALADMQYATPFAPEMGSDQSFAQHNLQAVANGSVGLTDFFKVRGQAPVEENVSGQGGLNTTPIFLDQGGGTSDISFSLSEALHQLAQSDSHALIALQDWFKSNSLSQRLHAVEEVTRVSSKRVVSDEDILSKAQRLAAKRNLEINHVISGSIAL